jgi:DNA-binding transcriptional MocR family regulator
MARPQQTSTEAILDSLAAHPEVTVADLADVLGIGRSTVAKRLDALQAAGTARREPGGREGGRRVADRWSATAHVADDAAHDGADHAASDGPVRSTDRLARGALGTLVQAYLAGRPGEDLGPTQTRNYWSRCNISQAGCRWLRLVMVVGGERGAVDPGVAWRR